MRRIAPVLALLGLLTSVATAQTPRSIELPQGEKAVATAFAGDSVVVLVQQGGGFAVRRINLPEGSLEVIGAPRSLTSAAAGAQVRLAASGTALALLQPDPREPGGRLFLYTLEGNRLDEVNLRQLPRDFAVAGVELAPDGSAAFVRAAPYVAPEQAYSVGRIELPIGRYSGAVLKNNVDLVEQFAVGNQRLLLLARGFRGEYPAAALAALHDLGSGDTTVLHARANGLQAHALADGTLLLEGNDETWRLVEGAAKLTRVRNSATALAATADGRWLAALMSDRGGALAVTSAGGATAFSAPAKGESLAISADGRYVCVVERGGTALLVFAIPAD